MFWGSSWDLGKWCMYILEMIWYGLAHQICFMMDLHNWDHLLGDCLTLDGCWLGILLLGAAIFLRVWWTTFMMVTWRPHWLDNIYCKSRCSPTFILEVWIQVNFKFSFKTRRTIRNIYPWSWLCIVLPLILHECQLIRKWILGFHSWENPILSLLKPWIGLGGYNQ